MAFKICIDNPVLTDYTGYMVYIHREIEEKIIRALATFPSIVLTGPRQSGKSTLLINTLKGYNYITLDDPLRREQSISDPLFFLDSAGENVIIDEIQYSPGLLSYIKMRIDSSRDRNGLYVFTGSQQFHMIKNLGDSLAGRVALLELLPFSVIEKRASIELKDTLDCFIHGCLVGSYPELVVDSSMDINLWYGSYIQTYLERDVRSIYNIGNLRDFQRFLQLLAARCSQVLNLSQLANDIGISVPTARNWLSILEATRIVFLLPPYYHNLGKRITKSPKLYFLDSGLVCYLTGIRNSEHLINGPMSSALFENFCIQETVKCFFNTGRRPPLYYIRTNNGLEVDLIIERSFQELIPVEIKLNKTPGVSMAGNIIKLKRLFNGLSFSDGFILSLAEKSVPLKDDVSVITLEDYLEKIRG